MIDYVCMTILCMYKFIHTYILHTSLTITQYDQAVKAGGMIYVSGCIGAHPETRALVDGGITAQTRQVLENLKNIIESAGSDLSNVCKCTVLLAGMEYFAEVNAIYAEYFPTNPPARATFAVLGLPANALVEIEAICIAKSN